MTIKNDFNILIIDENPIIDLASLLTKSLTEAKKLTRSDFPENRTQPLKIDTVKQGEECLNFIADGTKVGKRYAQVIINMQTPPWSDSLDLAKRIWLLDKDIQIVLLGPTTDKTFEEILEKYDYSNNLIFFKKPIEAITLRQITSLLTQKWQLMEEAREYTLKLEQRIQDRTHSLEESLSRVKATLESSTDGILVLDIEGKIIDFNSKFLTMWHLKKGILENADFYHILNLMIKDLASSDKFIKKAADFHSNPEAVFIDQIKFKDKRIFEFYTQPQKINQIIIGRIWSFRDITQKAHLEEKLQHQSTHDLTTGLPNRILLNDRIHQSIALSNRNKQHFAMLLINLDRFKLINESLSHAVGDDILRTIAERLTTSIRAYDTLATLSSKEFALVLMDVKKDDVNKIANHILKIIAEPHIIDKKEIITTASIGISLFPKDGSSASMLLRNANAAMSFAKKSGSNQFVFYTEKMNEENIKYLEKENELRQALANNEFFLEYQPQVELNTEKLIAVEALLRWNHPKKGVLAPEEFMDSAMETGLIIPIGEWILKTACHQNKKWQEAGLTPIRIAIKISSQQLRQYNFVKLIINTLEETKLKPEYLELEVTESTLVNNPSVIHTIDIIKEAGVKIALDEFGTGLSSLCFLKNLPLDRLKINCSFVQKIHVNQKDEVIINSIINLANNLNLEVLAEGVETQNQLEFLKEQKNGGIQGYYHNKSFSKDELERILKDQSTINKILP